MSMGFGFEEASRACQKWFSEDFEEEADGVAVALMYSKEKPRAQ